MTTRRLAKEWLWCIGCLLVAGAFVATMPLAGWPELVAGAVIFYVVAGVVRLTVWAVRTL